MDGWMDAAARSAMACERGCWRGRRARRVVVVVEKPPEGDGAGARLKEDESRVR